MNKILPKSAEPNRRHLLLILIISFLIFTYAHSVAKMLFAGKNFSDFANYYFFSQQLNDGRNIYTVETQSDLPVLKQEASLPVNIVGKAEYSPLFFLILAPLAHLPFWTANFIWLALNHLFIIISFWFIVRLVSLNNQRDLTLLACVSMIFFASQPLIENVAIGQSNLLILLFIVLIAYLRQHKLQPFAAGLLMAFVLLLKPQFLLIFLFFLWKRDYIFCISTLAAYLLFRAIGIIYYGFAVEAAYWQNLTISLAAISSSVDIYNVSPKGLLARLFLGPGCCGFSTLFYVAISAVLFFLTIRRIPRHKNESFLQEYSATICLLLLISPLTEEHHLVMVYLPLAAAFYHIRPSRPNIIMFVSAFLLISVRYSLGSFRFFDTGIPSILAWGKTAGVFLLWYVLIKHIPRYHQN